MSRLLLLVLAVTHVPHTTCCYVFYATFLWMFLF